MKLECTLILLHPAGRGGAPGPTPVEVTIELSKGSTGDHLAQALTGRFGVSSFSVGGHPLQALTPGTDPLRDGCLIVASELSMTPSPEARTPPEAHLDLVVLSGPDSGASLPLFRGQYHIGRGQADLPMTDPRISRRQGSLAVTQDSVIWTEHSTPGRRRARAKARMTPPSVLTTERSLRRGGSLLALRARELWTVDVGLLGLPCDEPLQVPSLHRGPGWLTSALTAVLSLLAGVSFAATTGSWPLLLFSVLSAVPLLIPSIGTGRGQASARSIRQESVRRDRLRMESSFPSLGTLLLAYRRHDTAPSATPSAGPSGNRLWVRLGTADVEANLTRTADPVTHPSKARSFLRSRTRLRSRALVHRNAPYLLNLEPGLSIEAGDEDYMDFVCGLIVQLTVRHHARTPLIVLFDPAKSFPSCLRYLPSLSWHEEQPAKPAPSPARSSPAPEVVVIAAPGVSLAEYPFLPEASIIVQSSGATPARGERVVRPGRVLRLDRAQGVVLDPASADQRPSDNGQTRFTPDLARPSAVERYCRGHSALSSSSANDEEDRSEPPQEVPLSEVLPRTVDEIAHHWTEMVESPSFRLPLGRDGTHVVSIDLVEDGPHVLVAGTTGSGKSGLLRTLVLSAACRVPPSELGLILVDFKGGSTFHDLQTLPQVQGLITDLGAAELERTLLSLRAEIRRREVLFAECGVSDWPGYRRLLGARDLPPLPRVCLIVDEFRMMMDHAPDSLGELIRLASIGRSLGLHLILATQRPQGAVSADIRANIGSCLVLRVQSELDSLDTIGTSEAARLPANRPGRTIFSQGASKQTFQLASGTATVLPEAGKILVKEWLPGTGLPRQDEHTVRGEHDVSGHWTAMILEAWKHGAFSAPRAALAPALPPQFDPSPAAIATIALLDIAEEQRLAPLIWSPGEAVGLLGSEEERTVAVTALLGALLHARTDGRDITLHTVAAEPGIPRSDRTSSHPLGTPDSVHHRISDAAAVDALLEQFLVPRSAALSEPPRAILYIESWETLVATFRRSDRFQAEGRLTELLRSAHRSGLHILLCGNEALGESRTSGLLTHVIHLRSAKTETDPGLRRALASLPRVPGRVVIRSEAHGGILHFAQLRGAGSTGQQPPRLHSFKANDIQGQTRTGHER
ncbi:FtsK/SpoIIIE domain-containing protein [Arthrobacter sp. NPDC090010]|uniref:FtsK/SpoIIIE domain-containing protein n=1 Tax=Arthrobacter sp. NPDC090010 TaxID=3363942 RepID=UPI003806BF1E